MTSEYQKTFELDENGDLKFTGVKTPSVITDPIEKVKQDLDILFKTQKREDAFNPNFGFDAFSVITSAEIDTSFIEKEVRLALEQYRFFKSLLSIDISGPSNRILTIRMEIETNKNDIISYLLEVG